ncbi:MAG: hypothetical protein ABW007_12915 [Chitinophagaceae bacterium]
MRKRYHWLVLALLTLSACSEDQKQADKLIQASSESLAAAVAMKMQQLEFTEARIAEITEVPFRAEKFKPIEIRIKRIVAFTNAANQQVKALRELLDKENHANPGKSTATREWAKQAGHLYIQLTLFRDSVLSVDWPLQTEFRRDFSLFGAGLDSIFNSAEDLSDLLQSVTYPAVSSFLSSVQFNILTAGWKCATYCLESIAYHDSCDSGPNLIISQNPLVVLPGASITVGFGVGIFPYANRYRMEVAVNNSPSTPLQNGIENILVKAEQKVGHYKVPLVIKYFDQDGKRQEIRKLIEYTVVDTLCGMGR